MARHAAPTSPRRTLLRAGLTVTAAGAALGLGGAAAQAAEPAALAPATGTDTASAVMGQDLSDALGHGTTGAVTPAKRLKLNPLAGTGVDPLDNSVGTQVADFKPLSTTMVTGPVTRGGTLTDLPAAGPAAGMLPG
ncbi:hypothetical protein [Streptomyces sp. NPDC058280]|uniref:hypothetical protein n=1 Tax=Streptomyces sp. NPDC058280 TaxID=3346419 RepID=UPI0036F186DD